MKMFEYNDHIHECGPGSGAVDNPWAQYSYTEKSFSPASLDFLKVFPIDFFLTFPNLIA